MAQPNLRLGTVIFLVCCGGLAACGASQAKTDDNALDTTPSASPSGGASADDTPKWSNKPSPKEDEALTEDQKAQMEIALRRGGEKAANCATVVPDAKTGEGEVKVTFDGKKGRAVEVAVGAPWAGTAAESCIKRSFVGEIIVPFEGNLEVPYTVKLPARPEVEDPKAKGKGKKK